MKILTVRQPWAHAIIHMGKTVENRPWGTDYRGPVAIHAGKQIDPAGFEQILEITGFDVPDDLTLGAVIGVVDLIDSHSTDSCIEQQHDGDWLVCSRWAERGGKHLVLANPRPIHPVPVKGALGLRELADEFELPVLRGGVL